MNQSNEIVKREFVDRAMRVNSLLVKQYLPDLIQKVDQMDVTAGIWLEQIEVHFDQLKPEGLMRRFEQKDFDDLWYVLTGQNRNRPSIQP